jgi:L-malate glycosyltransferase
LRIRAGFETVSQTDGQLAVKVLHLNNEKTWRGGERQTLLLATALPALGIGGSLACRTDGPLAARAKEAGVPILGMAGDNFRAALDLARSARNFDLIHCHTARTHGLAAWMSPLHGKPFVITRRVDFPPKRNWFSLHKYRSAAKIVCISQFIERQLVEIGVPTKKLAVIRSTVPIPVPSGQRAQRAAEFRERLGIAPQTKLVGNIGALVGHKDHATLLRAAKDVLSRRKDVAFVIVGDGELKDHLHRLRQELGLTASVHFAGFIPQAEELLGSFDVFAMSSCMEGLGSIVMDAFAARVPVAATAGGGLPELVRDNETGLLAPVADDAGLARHITRLLDDAALRERLCANARSWVASECSVNTMAARYTEVYREVLAR